MRKILLTMMALIVGTTLSFADDSYELVTSASSLAAGDEVLIVYNSSGSYYAMGSNYSGVRVTVSNNAITLASTITNVTRFSLEKNSNYWLFYSESNKGYLGVSYSSLTMTTNASSSNNVTLGFSGNSNGATSFKFSNRYLTYSNNRFTTTTSSNNSTNIRIFKRKIGAPIISPSGGNYNDVLKVSITSEMDGATIYYTTDGSTPTTASFQYTNAITIGIGTTTLKAIAVYNGDVSDVAEATYVVSIFVNAPTFSPSGGEYDAEQHVVISTKKTGATIYYTTDGSAPTTNSTPYTGAIFVGEGTTTLKAIAVYNGVESEVTEATFVVTLPKEETFHLVTDAATLQAGDTLLIAYTAGNIALGSQLSEGNRACATIAATGGSIVVSKADLAVTRLILGGSGNALTFKAINNNEGFLFNSGADGYLNTQVEAGSNAKASITIDTDGNANITFASEGSNNLLAYYLDAEGPGGDDPTPPIVGAPRKAPVADSDQAECFTFASAFSDETGYYPVQIYTKNVHEAATTTDINQDGKWDIADITMLVNYLLGQNPENCNVEACDVDGNGKVDADDIPALINRILSE